MLKLTRIWKNAVKSKNGNRKKEIKIETKKI